MKGGGGGTLIFSYKHRLGSFMGFKILNLTIWGLGGGGGGGGGGSEKIFFGGMKFLWIFLGGSSQNWTIFRGHFYVV